MAMAFLLVRSPSRTETQYPLFRSLLVGRGSEVELSLPDSGVSRQHASLRRDGATVVIEDLGSTNGTFVNGERIEAARRLESGDVIVIGATEIELRVETGEELAVSPATPTEVHRP